MAQLTLRLDERLAQDIKEHAAARGQSVNGWVVAVMRAATDPDLADTESERTRARLARAGLLAAQTDRPVGAPPDELRLSSARRAAGAGTPLSELVSDGRG